MDIQDLIALFRSQVDDEATPYLWSDDEVLRYIIQAQDEFVREIGGIRDSSTVAITQVSVTANTPLVAHSPYILRVRSAYLVNADRPLDIINEADVSAMTTSDYGVSMPTYLRHDDYGDVTAMVLGVEKNKIRWYKVPPVGATTDTCRMHVFRLPYPRIEDQEDPLEIDEQHHVHLLEWVKHKAFSKPDRETYDKSAAAEAKQAFTDYCDTAKTQEEGQRYKPRVVQYAGL